MTMTKLEQGFRKQKAIMAKKAKAQGKDGKTWTYTPAPMPWQVISF